MTSTESTKSGDGLRRRGMTAFWGYLGINVPLVAAVFLFPRYHLYLWGLLGLGSASAIVTGVIRHRPGRAVGWVLVGLALAAFASGDITYDFLTKFLHQTDPFPSVADVFYLATYPLLAAGLTVMVRARRRRDGDPGALLDALIVTSGCAAFSWVYLIAPYVGDDHLSLFVKLISIGYPLGDILFLCVLARLVFGGAARNTSVGLLTAGALGVLAADCVYGWIQLNGSWKVGGPTDVGWVLFYVCWGAAALHPSMRELTAEQPRRVRHLKPGTLLLLAAAALPAPLLIIWRDAAGEPKDTGVLAGATAVVFVLVMLRLTGLARAQAVYTRREQALRAFSEHLVAASDRLAVCQAAVDAVHTMGAAGVIGCVVTDALGPGAKIIATTWPDLLAATADVAVLDGPDDRARVSFGGTGTVAGISPGATWTHLALPGHDGRHEQIFLAHDRPLPFDLIAILDAIGAQLTLALERVELTHLVYETRTERKFQSMVQHSSDLTILLGGDQRVVYESPAVAGLLGRLPDALIGHLLAEFVHPDDVLAAQAQVAKVYDGGLGTTLTVECRFAHANGHWRTLEAVVANLLDEPDVGAIVVNSRDVTDRRLLEQQLSHQAFHDPVTGLANRALFLDRLAHAMARGDRQTNPVAVLFLDLDDFKMVNDSLGHHAGDELLVAVAARLQSATRPGDTIARFGGDEFAVLVEAGAMPETAKVVAGRITDALVTTFRIQDHDVAVRASIGIAIAQAGQINPDDLLRDADLSMYLAKRNGRGRFEMYQPDMHSDAVGRLRMAADLRRGLEAKQFEVFYQPIVNTHTGQVAGAEALVRWNHPSRGLVPPLEFIPTAETTGLIVPLGKQVLENAVRQIQAWRERGLVDDDFYISVNVSARQLEKPGFGDDIAEVLAATSLPARALVLEITESALMGDLKATLPRLYGLRAQGLRLAIDDFGTGYSSLSYLADLPVSFVKIDKSFVDRITDEAEGAAMVRGVIDLSRTLGLSCIAEGVEHAGQLVILDDLGCGSAQGYLFARPTGAAEMELTLTRLGLGHAAVGDGSMT